MPETCRDINDNKSQLLHQVGTSRHFQLKRCCQYGVLCNTIHNLSSRQNYESKQQNNG